MGRVLTAITVWQPWASLIAEGFKPYEFRGWMPPERLMGKPLAIHAGARPVKLAEVKELIYRLEGLGRGPNPHLKPEALPWLREVLRNPTLLPTRHMVCVARLVDVLAPNRVRDTMANDSDRGEQFNYAWKLDEVRRLEPPVRVDGRQGLWTWSEPDA